MMLFTKIVSYLVPAVFAQGGGGGAISLPNPISCTGFNCVATNILNGLYWIAVPLLGIMVLIGGFQIMTAGGNPEQFKKGRQTLLYAVIGFVCVLVAGGVVSIISSLTNNSCLAMGTRIDTPGGEVRVEDIAPGMVVWTRDWAGNKVAMPVLRTNRVAVPADHIVVHLVLSDAREVWVSPGHPNAEGTTVGDLVAGGTYDGASIASAERVAYDKGYTYDILPAGNTGFYWANGVLLGSTLR